MTEAWSQFSAARSSSAPMLLLPLAPKDVMLPRIPTPGCEPKFLANRVHGVCLPALEGSSLRPDDDASADVYGHAIKAKDIVRSEKMGVPATGRHLVDALQKSAPRNESERASNQ